MTEYRDRREELCAWLQANGIDYNEVPLDADMTIEADTTGQRWIRCEIYSTDVNGGRFYNIEGSDAARELVLTPLKTEPPHWWQPHTRPSREQLLETLGAVRQIHQPVEHCGKTICGHCSAWDGPETDSTDNAPVAYPCDTIKALCALPSVQIPLDLPDEPREAPCSTSSAT